LNLQGKSTFLNYPCNASSQSFNFDKGKSSIELSSKPIFATSSKDKFNSKSQAGVNFKIIKDKEIKATLNDFSEHFKVQTKKSQIQTPETRIDKIDLASDFQIPFKHSNINESESKNKETNPKERKLKTCLEGSSNLKFLLTAIERFKVLEDLKNDNPNKNWTTREDSISKEYSESNKKDPISEILSRSSNNNANGTTMSPSKITLSNRHSNIKTLETLNSNKNLRKCENTTCEYAYLKKNINVKYTKVKSQKGKTVWLCSACLKKYNMRECCLYCFNSSSQYDGKNWIQCDGCTSWQHIICEESNGVYKDLEKNDVKDLKYFCPICRSNKGGGGGDKKQGMFIKNKSKRILNEKNNVLNDIDSVKLKKGEVVKYANTRKEPDKITFLGHKRGGLQNDIFEYTDFKPKSAKKQATTPKTPEYVFDTKGINSHIKHITFDNRDLVSEFHKLLNNTNQSDFKKQKNENSGKKSSYT